MSLTPVCPFQLCYDHSITVALSGRAAEPEGQAAELEAARVLVGYGSRDVLSEAIAGPGQASGAFDGFGLGRGPAGPGRMFTASPELNRTNWRGRSLSAHGIVCNKESEREGEEMLLMLRAGESEKER